MRARARHTHAYTSYTRTREREREDAAYLPSRSTSLSQRNCPGRRGRSLPSPSRSREREGGRQTRGWKIVGEMEEGRPYITAHEKRPSTGRLISEALPPPPFKANPRPGHESRHSTAPFHPPPSLFHLTRMKSVIFLLSISFDTEKKKNPRRQRRVAAIFET